MTNFGAGTTGTTQKPRRKVYGINAKGKHPLTLADRMNLAGAAAQKTNKRKGMTHHVSKAARQRDSRRLAIAKKRGWIAQTATKLPVYLLTQKERAFFQSRGLLPYKGAAKDYSKLPAFSARYKPGEVSTFANTKAHTPKGERIWKPGDPAPGIPKPTGTDNTKTHGTGGGTHGTTFGPGSTVGKPESGIKPLSVYAGIQLAPESAGGGDLHTATAPKPSQVPVARQSASTGAAELERKKLVRYLTRPR